MNEMTWLEQQDYQDFVQWKAEEDWRQYHLSAVPACVIIAELERDFWESRENEPPYVPGVLEPADMLPF